MNNKTNLLRLTGLMMIVLVLSGCIKNLYDPNNAKNQKPSMDDYFDFATTTDISLSVDYALKGMPLLLELYGENPLVDGGHSKRADVLPLFKAFTDMEGRYEGVITLPIGVETVYLYSREMGVPQCVELAVENGAIAFDNAHKADAPATRASYDWEGTQAPYPLSGNYYALYKWDQNGKPQDVELGTVSELPVWNAGGKTGEMEGLAVLTKRLTELLWGSTSKPTGLDNTALVGGTEQTNLYTTTKPVELSVMFLHEITDKNDVFGYYYYKGKTAPEDLKMYVIFPSMHNSSGLNSIGKTVQLQFFGESGTATASDTFPEGYTIGWFVIPDGFVKNNSGGNKNKLQFLDGTLTSDEIIDRFKFISVYDERLRTVVVGCEDGTDQDKSYEDLLFCILSDGMDSMIDPTNPDRPFISIEEAEKITLPGNETYTTPGSTLAFEDIWPSGGDYDMNDVVVEYTRSMTINTGNKVLTIEDSFVPVHDGAALVNGFAYQLEAGQLGKVVSLPEGAKVETETNSIIVFEDAQAATNAKKAFTIKRDLSELSLDETAIASYNPFIFRNEAGEEGRVEVHLPKMAATSLAASLSLTGDDAYYVNRDGEHPFAISIPIVGYQTPAETVRIDVEYPEFELWVKSKGTTNEKWYLYYAGGIKSEE